MTDADGTATIVVVMGVAGSGKSTTAGLLADRLGWISAEGDDLHPRANVEKMASGIPLTDEDRWPWLALIAEWIDQRRGAGEPGIITCSALKRAYREQLARPDVTFVHLLGDADTIAGRLEERAGHFMPAFLLDSQFEALEPLERDENGIVIPLGASPEVQADVIIDRLRLDR